MNSVIKYIFTQILILSISYGIYAQQVEVIDQHEERNAYEGKSYLVSGSLKLKPGFTFNGSQGKFFCKVNPAATPFKPDVGQNFVRVEKLVKEGFLNEQQVFNAQVNTDKVVAIEYSDGLGRSIQSIAAKSSPSFYDVLQPAYYDEHGRPSRQYLPYVVNSSGGSFQTQPVTDQQYFYANAAGGITADTRPYGESIFDNSPLGRVVETTGVGSAWTNYPVESNIRIYEFTGIPVPGTVNNPVHIWDVVNNLPKSTSNYPNGSLIVSEMINEEGQAIRSYSDFMGLKIMDEVLLDGSNCLRTYYVRNPYGEVLFVIPPIASNNLNPNQTYVDQWCYQFEYDEQQRLVGKKSPGAGWVYTIYDRWERPVLTQDANQRGKSPAEWNFIKYDELNRPIIAGIYKTAATRASLITTVASSTGRYETHNGTSVGYSLNQSFPTTVIEDDLLSITYFDDYSFKDNAGWDLEGNSYSFASETGFTGVQISQVKNLITGGKIRVLGESKWLNSVTYYDAQYRTLQVIAEHYLGKTDRITNEYDFTGQVLKSLIVHSAAAAPDIRIIEWFDYDHAGRLLKAWHKINSQPEVLISDLQYNELGQLIKKRIHSMNNAFLQVINYRYNIRGWLTHLNYNTPEINEPEDYFNLELAYQNELGTGNLQRHDGLITAARWQYSSNEQNVYNYDYVKPGYLTSADFKANSGSGWTSGLDNFNESASYDPNGNITALSRNSSVDGSAVTIDNLSYSYSGNQLMRVDDLAPTTWKELGFDDGNTSGNDYQYDPNGNLIADQNKNFTIEYNLLNLPSRIIFSDGSYLKYTYDASGEKLSQAIYNSQHQVQDKTDYIGLMIYHNNVLTQVQHPDGYLTKDGSNFSYYYYLIDHLGSTRVVLQADTDVSSSTATLETAQQSTEQNLFLRYDNARRVQSHLFDKTNGSSTGYAARLNGTTNERYGLAKSLSVMPGDTVNIEVFAKYVDTNSSNWTTALNTLLTQIASGTAPAGTVVDGVNYTTSTSSFQFGGLLNTSGSTGNGPKAYLNWLIFDREFNYVDGGFVRLSDAPREYGQDVAHEKLSTELIISQAGYVYTYLSNENETPVEVYFDDFTVAHSESPVVQLNDYYPYGMLSRSYLREDAQFTNYLFQGKQYDSLTQWHDFHARQYDATLGRWFAVDPASQFASPYEAMGNMPTMGVDPDGKFFWVALPLAVKIAVGIGAAAGAYSGYKIGQANGAKGLSMFGYIAGGAVIGGISGYMGGSIAAAGGAFSNTMSIAYASTLNSIGMSLLSGGQSPVVTSFGGFSYDFTNNEWGYFGKKGNTGLQNMAYGFGALANLQDAFAGFKGKNIEVGASNTELDKGTTVPHSYIQDASNGEFYVSVANKLDVPGDTWGEWIKNSLTLKNKWGAEYWTPKSTAGDWKVTIYNVNGKLLKAMQTNIKAGERLLGGGTLRWGGFAGCVNQSGRALWYAGIPTLPINLIPSWLNAQLTIRQIGIWSSPYFVNRN